MSADTSEFLEGESEITHLQRRSMLKLMGASLALSGVGVACRRPAEKILPYAKQPEQVVPGVPTFYASVIPTHEGAFGVLIESHEGRPTKIEGNPEHPASLGKTDFHAQASILGLYDPDRSRFIKKRYNNELLAVEPKEWDNFFKARLSEWKQNQGEGLAFYCGKEEGPSFFRLYKQIQSLLPKASFVFYDPLCAFRTQEGIQKVFGANTRIIYQLDKAKRLFCLQADPLMRGPFHVRYSKDFSKNRRIHGAHEASKMNRLYAAEASFSVTGTHADHRLPIAFDLSLPFLAKVALEIHGQFPHESLSPYKDYLKQQSSSLGPKESQFARLLASDLAKHQKESLVIVGEELPVDAHILGCLINLALKGQGETFKVIENPAFGFPVSTLKDVENLVENINQNKINSLIILGQNPSYQLPKAIGFDDIFKKLDHSIHLGTHENETAKQCHWHLPESHFLECFSDAMAHDGTLSIAQPLIAPLFNTQSKLEFLARIIEEKPVSYSIVQKTFLEKGFSENQIKKSIHDGVFSLDKKQSQTNPNLKHVFQNHTVSEGIEIAFLPSYTQLDGRFATLGWLQELPDPITKLAWDNALWMSPALASKLGIKSQVKKRLYEADWVEINLKGQSLQMPVFIVPGLSQNTVVAFMGYGRRDAGVLGSHVGVDVFPLMPKEGPGVYAGVQLKAIGKNTHLATTQEQFAMNGDYLHENLVLSLAKRDPARVSSLKEYEKNPHYVKEKGLSKTLLHTEDGKKKPLQITDPWPYPLNKWGMSIDLTTCTGCNACVMACQAENNIPVVGREQVMRSRSLHWIRIDRYFTGPVSNPVSIHQPVNCMHCENAPCEPVCPVAATTHDTEGLNVMTYNRCIGTRYCANNCPYKVRRFNYLDFSHSGNLYVDSLNKERGRLLQMQANPDVTVRYRGVMEKCTYCTQRIQGAKVKARHEKRDPNQLKDADVIPACAQACPTDAIVFGNLNDPESQVSKLKALDRNYDLLEELNTRPRTSYLSRLRNLNPHFDEVS